MMATDATPATYRKGRHDFTSAEIDQVCALVHGYNACHLRPAGALRTRLTRSVRRWAIEYGVLTRAPRADGSLWKRQAPYEYVRPFADASRTHRFNPLYDLPTEALWRLVKPMLRTDGPTGYSMSRHEGWLALDIYPRSSRYENERSRQEQEDVLSELARWGYLYVQMAGTIWELTPREGC